MYIVCFCAVQELQHVTVTAECHRCSKILPNNEHNCLVAAKPARFNPRVTVFQTLFWVRSQSPDPPKIGMQYMLSVLHTSIYYPINVLTCQLRNPAWTLTRNRLYDTLVYLVMWNTMCIDLATHKLWNWECNCVRYMSIYSLFTITDR